MALIERTSERPDRGRHAVTNQPPPLAGYDLYEADRALSAAVEREGAGWASERLHAFGTRAGGEPLEWGMTVNRHGNEPLLRTHDRYGNRVDEVVLPAEWHALLRMGIEGELHALPWNDDQPGAHVARGALFILLAQVESGVMCPISMTYSSIPALAASPELAAQWEPRLTLADYDRGALCGMAMTEKQGGSDVGANTTQAEAVGGGEYRLAGHKWFCSYPSCDAFLVLARTPDAPPGSRGLSCFLLPRVLEDGSRNEGFRLQRLKDKLGTRSLPSSEVEFDAAPARLIGEEGEGLRTILEMVNHTRLDCVLGSAAGMRRSVAEATHHTAHRAAFGKLLADQPLMQNVLADICVESEAATAAALRLARAFDEADERRSEPTPEQRAFKRIATAVVKYWVCKRAPALTVEALECLGGNGFVEESVMPRLYRDSELNSVWEGSGNVIALDVLRALVKEPGSLEAFLGEVEQARGADPRLDGALDRLRAELPGDGDPQLGARRLVERMALTLQGALLVRAADSDPGAEPVADAFLASRLEGDWGHAFGTLAGADYEAIVARHRPQL